MRFIYNSISGARVAGNNNIYGLQANYATSLTSRNNIIKDNGASGSYAYYLIGGSSFLPGGSDFNDLYCPPGGQLANLNGTFYSNLAAWQASPGNPDTSSLSVDPLFRGRVRLLAGQHLAVQKGRYPDSRNHDRPLWQSPRHILPQHGRHRVVLDSAWSILSAVPGRRRDATRRPDVQLTWNVSANADTYLLYLSRDSLLPSVVSRQTDTSYLCSGLLRDSTYFWKVVAWRNTGGTRAAGPLGFPRRAHPPDTNWVPEPSPPLGGRNKTISDGGAMASLPGNGDTTFSFLLKGNNTCEFYIYNSATGIWTALESIPRIGLSGKKKTVKKGSALVAVAGKLYAFKGNSTNEFWCYTPSLPGPSGIAASGWQQYTDVPGDKKCKDGTSATTVVVGGVPYVYLLKGGTNEFYRNSVAGKGTWETETGAPLPPSGKVYKTGSAIVYYPDDKDGKPRADASLRSRGRTTSSTPSTS